MKLSFSIISPRWRQSFFLADCTNPISLSGWFGGPAGRYSTDWRRRGTGRTAPRRHHLPALAPAISCASLVFGEDDLGGQYDVDGSGLVRLPLIGEVQAAGLRPARFRGESCGKLADIYLKDPKVSVEVVNFRPFYIMGGVNKPGEYPYVNDMSILNAVALARAAIPTGPTTAMFISDGVGDAGNQVPADPTTKVAPGDIIRIPGDSCEPYVLYLFCTNSAPEHPEFRVANAAVLRAASRMATDGVIVIQ